MVVARGRSGSRMKSERAAVRFPFSLRSLDEERCRRAMGGSRSESSSDERSVPERRHVVREPTLRSCGLFWE